MRSSILFTLGSDPVVAGGAVNARIEDVRLAACLLVAAASAAESEIASSGVAGLAATHWSADALAAAGPLGKIIKAGIELEAAITTMRASIAAVEVVRASMPDAKTQATIATVSKTIAAVSPCVEAVEREAFPRDLPPPDAFPPFPL